MAYKVAIDSSNSSENKNGIVEKDFTFTIAKYINERLNNIGIENFLVDETSIQIIISFFLRNFNWVFLLILQK